MLVKLATIIARQDFTQGCAWVGLRGIFLPNLLWWVKKNLIQPNSSYKSNSTQLTWVGLNSWVG